MTVPSSCTFLCRQQPENETFCRKPSYEYLGFGISFTLFKVFISCSVWKPQKECVLCGDVGLIATVTDTCFLCSETMQFPESFSFLIYWGLVITKNGLHHLHINARRMQKIHDANKSIRKLEDAMSEECLNAFKNKPEQNLFFYRAFFPPYCYVLLSLWPIWAAQLQTKLSVVWKTRVRLSKLVPSLLTNLSSRSVEWCESKQP